MPTVDQVNGLMADEIKPISGRTQTPTVVAYGNADLRTNNLLQTRRQSMERPIFEIGVGYQIMVATKGPGLRSRQSHLCSGPCSLDSRWLLRALESSSSTLRGLGLFIYTGNGNDKFECSVLFNLFNATTCVDGTCFWQTDNACRRASLGLCSWRSEN